MCKAIWSLPIILQIRLFLWKCYENILSRKVRIGRYNSNNNLTCSMCNNNEFETAEHILKCDFSTSVWNSVPWGYLALRSLNSIISIKDWVKGLLANNLFTNQKCVISTTAWYIWRDRCMHVFQNISMNKKSTTRHAIKLVNEMR